MSANKVLVIVDNYQYAKNLQDMVDWNQLGLEVVGLEYNGALALEQFRILEPAIVIMDSRVPIIGVDRFVQLMQGYSNDFVVILLDDAGEMVSSNIQHVFKTLKKSSLDLQVLAETLKDAATLLQKDTRKGDQPRYHGKIHILASALGTGDFAIENLYKVRNEITLNLSSRLRILLPRPARIIQQIPDALIFELYDVLDKFCGGEIIQMKDGLLCILINDIASDKKTSAESKYEQLLYEIRWALNKYFKPHFTFFLSKSIPLTELSENYAKLHHEYGYGYFLREVKIVNPNFLLKPTHTEKARKCESAIMELSSQIIRNSPNAFENALQEVYLNHLKQSMSFKQTDLFRFKLYLLYQAAMIIFIGSENQVYTEIFSKASQTIEDEHEQINAVFKGMFQQFGQNHSQTNVHVFNALVQIINHFQESISLSTIAKNILVTPTYLSHLFAKELGVNFSDYLADVRITRAKHLILDDAIKINEVALEAGFSDYRYFSQVFRKITGLTPSEYRLRMSVTNVPQNQVQAERTQERI